MTPYTPWIDVLLVYLLLACAYVVWRGRQQARKSTVLVFATSLLLLGAFLLCGPSAPVSAALLLMVIVVDPLHAPVSRRLSR